MKKTGLWACLRRNEEGVTAIEFALIAPTLMLLMMGIIEISLIQYAEHVMEGAMTNASRLGKTGYVDVGLTQEEMIVQSLHNRLGGLVDANNVVLTSKSYSQFDQIGDPEPFMDVDGDGQRDPGESYTDVNGNGLYDTDMGSVGYGTASEVVVYTATYSWPIFTPMMEYFLGNNGSIPLSARAVVQNEPY